MPAPSAERSSAPRLCGSSTPSSARKNRRPDAPGGAASRSSSSSSRRSRRKATTPWCISVRTCRVKLLARLGGHADAGSPGQVQEPGQPGVAAAFAFAGDRDVVNSLRAGAQRLLHRVQTVENLHLFSVRGRGWASDSSEKTAFLALRGRVS